MGYLKNLKKKAAGRWGKGYASSYWYDEYDRTYDAYEKYTEWGLPTSGLYKDKKSVNIYKLASVRRAIANFVQIVTGKNIPVTFHTKSDSKTNGTSVILSADVNDNFDVSVGLALHEGSHIVLSDFGILKAMHDVMDTYERHARTDMLHQFDAVFSEGKKYGTVKRAMFGKDGTIRSKVILTRPLFDLIMNISNWIEDRRIDHYIYTTAPGYRSYYLSLYDHYFNDKIVTKGIESDEFTDETLDSYFFRIINLLNEKTDLNKLKGLKEIVRMLDLKNISRIKSSEESLELSIAIVSKMLEYCDVSTLTGKSASKSGDGDINEDGDDEIEIDDLGDDFEISECNGNDGKRVRLSPKALEQLKKKIEKQKQFLNGDIKKKKLAANDLKKIDNVDQSDTELNRVGQSIKKGSGGGYYKGVDCIVVKRVTDGVVMESDFPCPATGYDGNISTRYIDDVNRGIELGTILGKKLQIRAESRETVFSRLKRGKIDKRMISSLGFDNESVFFTHHIDQFKKVNLHISIDYSGSMEGKKIKKAITSTVAIVKACIMARNIDVQVSIRATGGSPQLPWVGLIFDSKRGNFRTFCKYMAAMRPAHVTPEGLCFEAIHKYLIPATNDTDSYFLNFSDGQPSYSINNGNDAIEYSGDRAAEHTYSQIKRMGESGIKVLSYFITEGRMSEHDDDYRIFKASYKDSAKFINVENMMEVAKTMNETFLKK